PHYRDSLEQIFKTIYERCHSIIDFSIIRFSSCLNYLEILWVLNLQHLILYQNYFEINLMNMKLSHYSKNLAKSLPKYIKEIKIWIILNPNYENELILDDLRYFFNNLDFKNSFALLEIIHPYQVFSRNIHFDKT
ncbi:9645_t:CDS:1, partial [Scutellospora calospora]